MSLTERQREIYDYIVAFRRGNGCSPSIPELQRHFGIRSPNGVAGHLHALEAKGIIRRAERGSRQIDVVAEQPAPHANLHSFPVFGLIPAGPPQEYQASTADSTAVLDVDTLGFRPREGCFALKVRGDSMVEAGILNGDMVVIEPTPTPRAGQIVAALIDGECTLKRLVRVKGRWFLKAENSAYPELHPRADLVIQGVVRTVVRKLD
ncbi:MAG: repressor LexA [Acidobacteria bacterium]|nr:repressor LexA [Acidobacteriota bacterium]